MHERRHGESQVGDPWEDLFPVDSGRWSFELTNNNNNNKERYSAIHCSRYLITYIRTKNDCHTHSHDFLVPLSIMSHYWGGKRKMLTTNSYTIMCIKIVWFCVIACLLRYYFTYFEILCLTSWNMKYSAQLCKILCQWFFHIPNNDNLLLAAAFI